MTLHAGGLPCSPACERNKKPIFNILRPFFDKVSSVLEVGSGTGQHAAYFTEKAPHLIWQTSDQKAYLKELRTRIESMPNLGLPSPLELDVNQPDWLSDVTTSVNGFDAVFTANTLHIMSEVEVVNFFSHLPTAINKRAYLFIYGPFKYLGKFTSKSNADFDEILRARNVGSAIRDSEMIVALANDIGFSLLHDFTMPANNQCLVFSRGDS